MPWQTTINLTTKAERERERVSAFLESIIGNSDFNRRLDNALRENSDDFVVKNAKILTHLNKFAFKTRKTKGLYKAVTKLKRITDQLEKKPDYKPGRKERLTIAEYARIAKLTDLGDMLSTLSKNNVIGNSEALDELQTKIGEAKEALGKIEQKVEQSTEYKSGDIIAEDARKMQALSQSRSGWMFKFIARLVLKYSHISVGRKEEQSKHAYSHVSHDGYETKKGLDVFTPANTTFRIRPEKLIGKRDLKALTKQWNCKTPQEVSSCLQIYYEEISSNIQNQLSVLGISYDDNKFAQAEIATVTPGGHKNKSQPVRSWAEKFSKDKGITAQNKEQLLGGGEGMICSEYVAKVTAISMVQLNEALNVALGRGKDEKLVKLPLNKFENLDVISPERLIKQLQKRKCIEPVKKAKVISQVFR